MSKRPYELLLAAWTQVAVSLGILIGFWIFALTSNQLPFVSQNMYLLIFALGGLLLIQHPIWLNASRLVGLCCPLILMAFLAMTNGNSTQDQGLWASGMLGLWLLGTAPALFSPRVHLLLLNPHMRWWLNAPRKKLQNKVVLSTDTGHCLLSTTEDISRTGAFIPMSQSQFEQLKLMPGDSLQIRLWLRNKYDDALDLKAKVVRHGYGSDWTKSGLGLHFIQTDHSTQQELNRLTAAV